MSAAGNVRLVRWVAWSALAIAAVFAASRAVTTPPALRSDLPRHAAANGAASAPAMESASIDAAAPDNKPATPTLRFPNGVAVAALNGVTMQPAVCAWGDHPWSPIVRRAWNDGLEWYVHADGTYTTTRMCWRSDLARDDAVTLCVHPMAGVATPYDHRGGG